VTTHRYEEEEEDEDGYNLNFEFCGGLFVKLQRNQIRKNIYLVNVPGIFKQNFQK